MSAQRERRQVVRFAFYKLDNAWRRLSAERQASSKLEFGETIERFAGHLLLRPYGLVGIRGDCDFLLWQVAEDLDSLVALQTALNRTDLGGYLTLPYSYLAMTRRSIYEFPEDPSQPSRLVIRPSEARYLFVYPFTKTRPWYMLPKAERQTMMDEHVRIGRQYPSIRLNTTYSYGLDDQELIVAFFNVNGTVYAIANRCTHARASLSEGAVDPARCAVTCPWHEGVFSLETGQVLGGPPSLPIAVYRVKLEGDTVLIAPAEAREPTVAPRSS